MSSRRGSEGGTRHDDGADGAVRRAGFCVHHSAWRVRRQIGELAGGGGVVRGAVGFGELAWRGRARWSRPRAGQSRSGRRRASSCARARSPAGPWPAISSALADRLLRLPVEEVLGGLAGLVDDLACLDLRLLDAARRSPAASAASLAFISSAYFSPDSIVCWRSSIVASTGLNPNRQSTNATTAKLTTCARIAGKLTPKASVIWVTCDMAPPECAASAPWVATSARTSTGESMMGKMGRAGGSHRRGNGGWTSGRGTARRTRRLRRAPCR